MKKYIEGIYIMKTQTQAIFEKLATLENALEYQAEQEKFLFCVELLSSENLAGNETQVNILEDMFDELLENSQ